MLECADFPGHDWPTCHRVNPAWFLGGGFPWHSMKVATLMPSPQWLFNWCFVLKVWVHLVHGRAWSPWCPSLGDSFPGETLGRGTGLADLKASLLWVFPVCIFSPWSVLKTCSHWSQSKDFFWREVSSSDCSLVTVVSLHFFLRNSSFLFRFLFKVERLFLFFSSSLVGWLSLVSREMVMELPRVRLRLKWCPLLASAWQKSRHLVSCSRASSPPVVIFKDNGYFSEVPCSLWSSAMFIWIKKMAGELLKHVLTPQ